MNFLMTCYMYPLKEMITISDHLKFCFDNPRGEEEIADVKDALLEGYNSEQGLRLPLYSDEPDATVESFLFEFYTAFSEDDYVESFFQSYRREEILEFMAKMWIIA